MLKSRVLGLALILISSGILLVVDPGPEAERTELLYDNSGATMEGGPVRVTDGGGLDTQYYFRVGKGVPISEARLNISTHNSHLGHSLKQPFVDVGLDGRSEWSYEGAGYGDFGQQTVFSDDKDRRSLSFPSSGGTNSGSSILIPAGSEIIDAEIGIRGRFIPQSITSYQIEKDPASVSINGYAVEEGDMDLDGDMDIVVSDTKNSRILWFENPNSTSGEWIVHTVYSGYYVDNCYSIDLGDIDGDGDLDVAASSYSRNYVMYIRNDNRGASFTMYRFQSSFNYAGRVRIADIDQDGNPDIVVAAYYYYHYSNYGEYIYWFKAPSNPDTTSGWSYYSVYTNPTYYFYTYHAMDVEDLNGDGYPDIVVGTFPQYSYYGNDYITRYINPKTTGTWSRQVIDSSAGRPYTLEIEDMNNDGAPDIIAGQYDLNRVSLYTSSSSASSWSRTTMSSFTNPKYLRIYDLNRDGKKDVLVGGGSGIYELAVLEQGASSSSYTKKTVTNSVIDPMAFSAVDSDGDSDLDMFVSGTSGSQLVLIETTDISIPQFKVHWLEDGGVKDIRAMDHHDIDGDGDLDMVIGAYSTGWIGWCENDGTPFDGAGTLHKIGSIGNPIKIMMADVDGDDDKDVMVLSAGGAAVWFENQGFLSSEWASYLITSRVPNVVGMFGGDFTGDGKADLAVSADNGYSDGFIRLYEAPSDPRTPDWNYNTVASSGLQYMKNIWADDMDKDGDLDLLGVYGAYGTGACVWYRNPKPSGNPMSGSWAGTSIKSGMYYTYDVKTVDITDDGYPDVVTTGTYYYSKVYWHHNPLGRQVNSWTSYVLFSGSYDWKIAAGDIGGDGYADIVFSRGSTSSPSTIYWYEEPEDYTQSWIEHGLGSYSGTWDLAIADLEGDGIQEILSTSTSLDEVRAYRINAIFPQNIQLDIGADEAVSDWNRPGELKGPTRVDIRDALQEVLDQEPGTAPKIRDKYGTYMLSIPVEISSSSLGKIAMENIFIRYNTTVLIDRDGTGKTLSSVLDRLIPNTHDPKDPYIRIYVGVGAMSSGGAYLSDLEVEYNAIPKQTKPLPELYVDEDSSATIDRDLTEYFSDDYTPSKDLNIRIRLSGPQASKIRASVVNNRIVLDSTVTRDFYTRMYEPYDIRAKLIVEDSGGPNNVPSRSLYTNDIPVFVRPMNDPPVATGEILPTLYASEGQTSIVADLDDHNLFYDVDGDKLNYMLVPDLDDPGYEESAGFAIKHYPKNGSIEVSLLENSDWTGTVKVRLYATDQPEFNLLEDPRVDFVVSVGNINDGPYWLPVPDQEVSEDLPVIRLLELSQFAMDMDTPRSGLSIQIIDYTQRSFLTISTDKTGNGMVHVNVEPRLENWNGRSMIWLSLTDGEFLSYTTFNITILPVNDPPTLKITSPQENGRFEPGYFWISGEASDIEGLAYIEVEFNGETKIASGLNSWGTNLSVEGSDGFRENVPIIVRAYDTQGAYVTEMVNITIMPVKVPPPYDSDDDGVPDIIDEFPFDPSEYKDSDKDGIGDRADRFPMAPEWQYDSDNDGFADKADTDPFDPGLWDDKDRNGKNDNLDTGNDPGDEKDDNGKDHIWPRVLFTFSGILLIIAFLSMVLFISKRKASRDPRAMARYYSRQQKNREKRHDLIERLPLTKLVEKFTLSGDNVKPTTPGLPGPTRAAPTMSRPGLPPIPTKAPINVNGRYLPVQTAGMRPAPPPNMGKR